MPALARPSRRTLPVAALALGTALALAACGSNGNAATGNSQPVSPSTTGAGSGAGGGAAGGQGLGRGPGTSGLIAAVTGTTMQVQTRTDQTAVTWTGATTFSRLAPATLSDVVAGACVTVLQPVSSATPAPGSGATTPPTTLTAGTVQILPATNGACTGAAGGFGGGGRPDGTRTAAPTPTGGATGGAGGPGGARGGRGFGAFGTVSAVTGSTFTVSETGRPGATASASPAVVTVTTTATTTYLKQAKASATDVKVGECATALGQADQTGAVAATSVSLRPATNGSCTTGFGGRGPGGGQGSGGGGGGQGGGSGSQATTAATAHA